MKDTVLLIIAADRTIKVVHPSPNLKRTWDEIIPEMVGPDEEARIIPTSSLPSDRYFRNAWKDVHPGDQIDIDSEDAKNLHINQLRRIRNRRLRDLDLEVQRAIESRNDALIDELVAKKDKLRNMPELARKDMARMTRLETIKNYIPEDLK